MGFVLPLNKRQFLPTLILLAGGLSTLACPDPQTPGLQPNIRTPARQFIMNTVTIEERREGILLWRGKGARATGDFETTTLQEVHLTRLPQSLNEATFTLISPEADLLLSTGEATFSDALLIDPTGRTVKAGRAHYSEDQGTIKAQGPLELQAAGLQILGTQSRVDLGTGTINIEGPINGVFTPPRKSP